MNIAVLGGTFDPVHNGHLAVAAVVQDRLSPVEVVFMPAGQPYLKSGRHISPAADRVEMTRLATRGNPHWSLSTLETDRSGPTYTLDTIRALKTHVSPSGELYFILGWDKLPELAGWCQPKELIRLCRLVAVPRVRIPVPDLAALDCELPDLSKRVILLDKPEIDISASIIRERVRLGMPIDHLVPPAVADYIKERRLYLDEAPS